MTEHDFYVPPSEYPNKKTPLINKDHFLMGFAAHAATGSKDTTKVGAALVGDNGEVLLTSYNGLPIGATHSPDRLERPKKYLYACHAEGNIISFAARNGISTDNKTIFTTHQPCSMCARHMIQAGIKCVVVGDGQTSMPQEEFAAASELFQECGVNVRPVGYLSYLQQEQCASRKKKS